MFLKSSHVSLESLPYLAAWIFSCSAWKMTIREIQPSKCQWLTMLLRRRRFRDSDCVFCDTGLQLLQVMIDVEPQRERVSAYPELSQDIQMLWDVLNSKEHGTSCCLMTSKHHPKHVRACLFQQSPFCHARKILASCMLHVVSIMVFIIHRPGLAHYISFKCLNNPCPCLQIPETKENPYKHRRPNPKSLMEPCCNPKSWMGPCHSSQEFL